MFDLVIRGGTVLDGLGSAPVEADVAITDGTIVDVGRVSGRGHREIAADGALVMPGFVDIHSHYDGQAVWDERLAPSSLHGVTTVVMGNCGVGFAPVRNGDGDCLIDMMEGIEDIPGVTLHEGLNWDEWESFPQFLDALDSRPHDVDVAAQVAHAPLRRYVMGDRARAGVMATDEEIVLMAKLAAEGIEAGAVGFTTDRSEVHRSASGEHTPTMTAGYQELLQIAQAVAATGKGVLQALTEFHDLENDFSLLRDLCRDSGVPLSFTMSDLPSNPGRHRRLLGLLDQARAEGIQLTAQVAPRSTGIILGLACSLNPFTTNPVYERIRHLPAPEQAALLRQDALRQELLAADEDAISGRIGGRAMRMFDGMFEMQDPPNYEPVPADSIAARAAALGRTPAELALDILSAGDGDQLLYVCLSNFVDGTLRAVGEMLANPWTVVGLGDGGAHVASICDASFPTTLLTYWGRDRSHDRLPLPLLVQKQTSATARTVGLHDRGAIAPGKRADINVIDFDTLQARRPVMRYDLPAGGRRLLQPATGYLHTFVAGQETYTNGEATGALPGRLVRAGRH